MAKAATSKRAAQGGRLRAAPDSATASARPSRSATRPSKDELLEYYRQMLLIRRFEERAGQLYGLGLIGGFCHLYIGQEAVAVGLQSALEPSARTASSPAIATMATCSPTASIPR